MFVGTYEFKLDSKNRVTVPQRYREPPKAGVPACSTFYLTIGAEGCIAVYTPEGWEKMMSELGQGNALAGSDLRDAQRLIGSATDVRECDSEGRIILADHLRDLTGLGRDVVWVGAVSRAEIWDKQRWKEYHQQKVSKLAEKIDKVSSHGFGFPGKTPTNG